MKTQLAFAMYFTILSLSAPKALFPQTQGLNPPEYGDISELINLRRVYIYTSSKLLYDHISTELKKYPEMEVVGKVNDAEFILVYAGDRVETGVTINTNRNPFTGGVYGTSQTNHKDVGTMKAIIAGSQPNTPRILWEANKSTKSRWRKDPEIKCTQEFIKELKKMRQEK